MMFEDFVVWILSSPVIALMALTVVCIMMAFDVVRDILHI